MQTLSPRATSSAQSTAVPQPRLVRAAHEFEAQMMKELLKPMTGDDTLSGSDSSTGSNSALGEFASEALGKTLSQRGGFGIAKSIIRSLSDSGNVHSAGKVTGNLHSDTVIKTSKSLK